MQRWVLLAEGSAGVRWAASLGRRGGASGGALAGAAAAAAAALAAASGLEARRREGLCRCESRPSGGSLHIWFVRHGETENNVLLRELGKEGTEYERARSSDPPLSALGREQVRRVARHPALARFFGQGKPPVELYASPLLRAVETAAPLQRALPGSPPIRVRPELTEVGGLRQVLEDGTIELIPGMTPDELRKRFPDLELDLSEVPSGGWWSEGALEDKSDSGRKAIRERLKRVSEWLRALRPEAPGVRHVIIIGHGALLSRLLCDMLGASQSSNAFLHGNTSVTHLELRGSVTYVHCLNWAPMAVRMSSDATSASVS